MHAPLAEWTLIPANSLRVRVAGYRLRRRPLLLFRALLRDALFRDALFRETLFRAVLFREALRLAVLFRPVLFVERFRAEELDERLRAALPDDRFRAADPPAFRFRVAAAFRADAERADLGRAAEARPPARPPLRAGPVLVFFPRPEPLFRPPPDILFSVAHARRSASFFETPRAS